MGSTRRLTVGQALVHYLVGQSVERDGAVTPFFGPMLGIFGHGNLGGIGEALESAQELIRFVPVRNEQAAVHAAAAYAWTKRRLGALACTTSVGPGATNLVTGAAGATINRLPVLLLPGDVFASGRIKPVLQQLETGGPGVTVNDALRPVSRYWARVEQPEQLLEILPRAMHVLTSPAETGAVTICLPQDTQVEAYDWPSAFLEPRSWQVARSEPQPSLVSAAARLIDGAARPMIVAGGGVRYSAAEQELDQFARAFGIPVVETQAGKGSLAWDHPFNLGSIGATGGLAANRYARDADLVIALGTRLGDFTTASTTAWQNPAVRFVAVNVDAVDAAKWGATAVVGDARQTLLALDLELKGMAAGLDEQRSGFVAALRREWDAEVDRIISIGQGDRPTQAQVIAAVNAAAGSMGTVINAAGSMPGDLHKLWRSVSPDDYHVEYGYSCMGYEIPGGLGVKLADPARPVFVLVGDGSYLMMNSEIVTTIQEHAPLTIVLVDSKGYASISALAHSMGARNDFNQLRLRSPKTGRLEGPPPEIDFVAHAASMGAAALRADSITALEAALDEAKRADRTTVIVVEVDPRSRVPGYGWWDVPVAEVSESATVQEARGDYERALQAER